MDAALLHRFQPEEYYRKFLADGVRPDGRVPQECRRARLQQGTFGAPRGSASVSLGHSTAVAGVRAEVVEASADAPAVGSIVASVEMTGLCAQAFRDRARAGSMSTFLSNALTDIFNSVHVFDPLHLAIRETEVCWCLHVDVVCLNYDGNAFDLCLLAALAALEDTRLPALAEDNSKDGMPIDLAESTVIRFVEVDPHSNAVVAEARRVSLISRPLPVTFAQLPGERWVVDPCAAEEELGASVSLCLLGGRWLIYHMGGSTDTERFLGELMPIARSCVPALTELLDGNGKEAMDAT